MYLKAARAAFVCNNPAAVAKQIAAIINKEGEGPAEVRGAVVRFTTGIGESAAYSVKPDGTIIENIGGKQRKFKTVAEVQAAWDDGKTASAASTAPRIVKYKIKKSGTDDELVVQFFDANGKHYEPADYFTDDMADAKATGEMTLKKNISASRGDENADAYSHYENISAALSNVNEALGRYGKDFRNGRDASKAKSDLIADLTSALGLAKKLK